MAPNENNWPGYRGASNELVNFTELRNHQEWVAWLHRLLNGGLRFPMSLWQATGTDEPWVTKGKPVDEDLLGLNGPTRLRIGLLAIAFFLGTNLQAILNHPLARFTPSRDEVEEFLTPELLAANQTRCDRLQKRMRDLNGQVTEHCKRLGIQGGIGSIPTSAQEYVQVMIRDCPSQVVELDEWEPGELSACEPIRQPMTLEGALILNYLSCLNQVNPRQF